MCIANVHMDVHAHVQQSVYLYMYSSSIHVVCHTRSLSNPNLQRFVRKLGLRAPIHCHGELDSMLSSLMYSA